MEKQEKKTSKIKTWWEKNKDKIADGAKTFAWYAGGFALGGFAMKKITEKRMALTLEHAHRLGLFKYFDPENGVIVETAEEACKVAERVLNK